MDPATFATELEILAVRGFGDMGKRARDRKIRDRFIAAQRSCGLRRHINGVPPDTPIRDIVDRCRVWGSHSEQTESGQGVDLDQDPPERSGDSRKPGGLREKSKERTVTPVVDPRVPVPVHSLNKGVGEGVFLMRTPGTWGEPVFAGGHFFSVLVAGMVDGCPGWPISGGTDWWNWKVVCPGK